VAEAKKGGGSNGKSAKGKKPKGKESDSAKVSQANPAPEEKGTAATETMQSEEASENDASKSVTEPEAPAQPTNSADPAGSTIDRKPEHMHQQRVSRILDAVLEEPVEESSSHHGFKHPLFLDVILAAGLLVAMAGFSIGMFKIYITHSAKQSINQQNYRAAIALLKGTPLPGFFNIAGSEDTVELLNRALYLDAISKLELNRDDQAAIDELQQIRPGSGYFELAQDLLRDNSPPPKLQLEGGASHDADPSDPEIKENKPIVPDDDIKDASP